VKQKGRIIIIVTVQDIMHDGIGQGWWREEQLQVWRYIKQTNVSLIWGESEGAKIKYKRAKRLKGTD